MDKAIEKFFAEREQKKLKAGKKPPEEIKEEFTLENWLPKAAQRAGQMSLSTHPCTFSHPSSKKNHNGKTTAVIAKVDRVADGFLRSGNVEADIDALGNAAALDVYEFLTLIMNDDKKKLLEHIERETKLAKSLLSISNANYKDLREGFLAIKYGEEGQPTTTSSKLKQVYFPVGDNYHQLSLLTPSGLVYKMHERIADIRKRQKEGRKQRKKGEYSDTGYDDLPSLTMIGYGGTKPQNISVLNNRHGGKAYLLFGNPPRLDRQKVRLPSKNFFVECLWPASYEYSFQSLHKLLSVQVNNIRIRRGRDKVVMSLFDEIVGQVWQLREQGKGWSERKRFSQLPAYQKHILDDALIEQRKKDDKSIDKFLAETALWIIKSYKKVLREDAIGLYDDEINYVETLIASKKEALL